MEMEIELNMTLTPSLAEKVRGRLSEEFELVAFKAADKFSLRPAGGSSSNCTIDQAIKAYLDTIEPIVSVLELGSGVVRVGAFFSEGEAASFSVFLSSTTVQMLAKHQFSIDVTCYPCS